MMKKILHSSFLFLNSSILMGGLVVVVLASSATTTTKDPKYNKPQTIKKKKKIKIAIIGGGVSGSFVSKYLTDYDASCNSIDSITLLDPFTYFPSSSHDPQQEPSIQIIPTYMQQQEDIMERNTKEFLPSSSSSKQRQRRRVRLESTDLDNHEILPLSSSSSKDPASQPSPYNQGGRVSTLILSDGNNTTTVELGASIIYQGNTLVMEMIRNDPTIQLGDPHHSSSLSSSSSSSPSSSSHNYKSTSIPSTEEEDHSKNHHPNTEYLNSWGIFNGISWPVYIPSTMSSFHKTFLLLWKYKYDLYRIQRVTHRAYQSFLRIYDILYDTSSSTSLTYESPDDIWKAVGLWKVAHCSLDELLNQLGFSSYDDDEFEDTPLLHDKDTSTSLLYRLWRKIYYTIDTFVRGRSLLRVELLTAMNLANNNQGNSRMTGLAGLVNYLAAKGPLFSIVGGNYKLIQSAIHQANDKRNQSCASDAVSSKNIIHIPTRVKTIISEAHNREQGIELYDVHGHPLGDSFDVVILAAPLQFADIEFLVKGSLFDSDLLYTMPLHGRVLVSEDESFVDANEHGHYNAIQTLPPSARRPYTQVVTTVVTNATLQASFVNLDSWIKEAPSSVVFTQNGQLALHGISAIRMLTLDGIYKIFSSGPLDLDFLQSLFGHSVTVAYVQTWGGTHGGATPNFNGGKLVDSPPFLLFDSAMNVDHSDYDGSSLYYTNGMETAVSAMEISAIGAKAVAKMIASRYGFLHPQSAGNLSADEL